MEPASALVDLIGDIRRKDPLEDCESVVRLSKEENSSVLVDLIGDMFNALFPVDREPEDKDRHGDFCPLTFPLSPRPSSRTVWALTGPRRSNRTRKSSEFRALGTIWLS